MAFIYSTNNFTVNAATDPHNDRDEGGHIDIIPKKRVTDRQALTTEQQIELARLVSVTGLAMTNVLRSHGVDIGRINYQDNGNWGVDEPDGPHLHIHVYGRATTAVKQAYGRAMRLPLRTEEPDFYANFKPLTTEDVNAIQVEIQELMQDEEYQDSTWGL